jgi:hypothetical protein
MPQATKLLCALQTSAEISLLAGNLLALTKLPVTELGHTTLNLQHLLSASLVPIPDQAVAASSCYDAARRIIGSLQTGDAVVGGLDNLCRLEVWTHEAQRIVRRNDSKLIYLGVGERVLSRSCRNDPVDVRVWREPKVRAETLCRHAAAATIGGRRSWLVQSQDGKSRMRP